MQKGFFIKLKTKRCICIKNNRIIRQILINYNSRRYVYSYFASFQMIYLAYNFSGFTFYFSV